MFVHMMIGEPLTEEAAKEVLKALKEDTMIAGHNGYEGVDAMIEEGGNMVVILSSWTTRENCLNYHSSRAYRLFVAKTQHLLAGNYVIKLFKTID